MVIAGKMRVHESRSFNIFYVTVTFMSQHGWMGDSLQFFSYLDVMKVFCRANRHFFDFTDEEDQFTCIENSGSQEHRNKTVSPNNPQLFLLFPRFPLLWDTKSLIHRYNYWLYFHQTSDRKDPSKSDKLDTFHLTKETKGKRTCLININ